MIGIIERIRIFRGKQKKYFDEFEEEIALRNLEFVKTLCCAGIFIFLLDYILTMMTYPENASAMYLIPVPVFAAIFWAIKRNLDVSHSHVTGAYVLTLIMYVFLLSVAIWMSIYPQPDVPSIYYHLFIVACPVFFILPFYVHMILVGGSYAVFSVLVVYVKDQDVWSHELFESFTAVIFAVLVMVLMSQFRLQSDSLKSKYFELSQTDGLTHLMNKVSGIRAGEQYLLESRQKEHYAVLFLDLDNFKHINDTYGHLMGDELLRVVAETLRVSCRTADVVCRFGGDEFLVLLKNIKSESNAVTKVEKIRKRINAIQLEPIKDVSCSIGVFYNDGTESATMDTILREADRALYQAKQKGKNCYHIVEKR